MGCVGGGGYNHWTTYCSKSPFLPKMSQWTKDGQPAFPQTKAYFSRDQLFQKYPRAPNILVHVGLLEHAGEGPPLHHHHHVSGDLCQRNDLKFDVFGLTGCWTNGLMFFLLTHHDFRCLCQINNWQMKVWKLMQTDVFYIYIY